MYRLIVSDLDETLLSTDDKSVSEANRAAIKAVREMGVRFVPASGRGFRSMDKTLKELGLYDLPEEYVISFNGGAITENRGNRVLHFQGIPFSTAEGLYRRGFQYDVCVHVYTIDTVYVSNFVSWEQDFLRGRMEVTEIHEKNLDFLKGQEIVKCLYMNTDHAYLTRIADELSGVTGDMDVSYSSNRYLEFNRKGVNKGSGLRKLAELLGVDMKDTIAIGDNYNDLTMIQAAGLGVGVANTVEEMKPLCDYVTAADCNHGAVAEVLHKFVLRDW